MYRWNSVFPIMRPEICLAINKLNPSEPPVKVPYKESGHMVRGNNVEILTLAENAAFVYWVTGEEKFARFATDIFNVWLVGNVLYESYSGPRKIMWQ